MHGRPHDRGPGARHASRWVPASLWAGCGLLLVVASTVPWTATGALAASSPVEAARLIRSGSVSTIPETWAAPILAIPLVGVLLLALSGIGSIAARWSRGLLLVAALLLVTALAVVLVGTDVTSLRHGALAAAVAVVAGIAACAAELRGRTA